MLQHRAARLCYQCRERCPQAEVEREEKREPNDSREPQRLDIPAQPGVIDSAAHDHARRVPQPRKARDEKRQAREVTKAEGTADWLSELPRALEPAGGLG
jgi:hypothetical protein